MNSPTISIILPVFNAQVYLDKSINSILNQSFSDFELIIIDDGSTDNSLAIINQYLSRDSRIRLISNPKNLGMARTLNKGIHASKGKFIARQDADDISLPSRLLKQLNFLQQHRQYAMCGIFPQEIDEHGQPTRKIYLPTSWKIIRDLSPRRCCFVHGSVMIRKSIFKKTGVYSESLNSKCGIEDFELWYRITQVSKTDNLPEFLYKLRKNPHGLTFTNLKRQQLEHDRVVKKNLATYSKNTAPGTMVSVVVPTYNRPQLLSQALKSIIDQTHHYLEIIIVDDGSSSVTKRIVLKYQKKDPRIIYVRQKHQGVIQARNYGLKHCHGEYIAMLDDDDLWQPTKITDQLRQFSISKVPNLGMVYSFHDWINVRGNYVSSSKIEINSYMFKHLMRGNIVCGSSSSVLIKSTVFDLVGYFDPTFDTSEDWQLWLRISALFGIDYIPKNLVSLRKTPGQRSERPWMIQKDRFKILTTALKLMATHPHLRTNSNYTQFVKLTISNTLSYLFVIMRLYVLVNYVDLFLFDPKRLVITIIWNCKKILGIQDKAIFFKQKQQKIVP